MKILTIAILMIISISSCSQGFGPGYKFDLFKNTPNWDLAKAVEKEDENAINRIIKAQKVDINLQEPKFGRTLLVLAVGNDKHISTKALLKHGANQNILDYDSNAVIHEATYFINQKKNTPEILQLLLQYGANPNLALIRPEVGKNTPYFYLPLMGAVENLTCAKILLDRKADPYYKEKLNSSYPVWSTLLVKNTLDDNLLVAKYMIVDMKFLVPNPILYTIPNHKPRDILSILEDFDVSAYPEKQKAKIAILNYLRSINFPQKGVYSK